MSSGMNWRCHKCNEVREESQPKTTVGDNPRWWCVPCLVKAVEPSAREHEAWEALRNWEVTEIVCRERMDGSKFVRVWCHSERYAEMTDPVDAVLAVVNAMKQDTAEKPPKENVV